MLIASMLVRIGTAYAVPSQDPGEGWSAWSLTSSGRTDEKSITEYRHRDVTGYQSTSYKVNDESKLVSIYYVDTEFVIYRSGSWISSSNAYSGDGTPKTYTNNSGLTFTPSQTVYSNKWGFRTAYTEGETRWGSNGTAMSHWAYSDYRCWSGICSGRPYGKAYSTTVNVGKGNVTINPYGDEVFDYRIVATGTTATWGNDRTWRGGYRFGLDEYGELNEYNAENTSLSCGSKGNGTSTSTSSWCYESRYGNKTYTDGQIKTGLIQDAETGQTVYVEGVNGNITLYETNRKNSDVWDGDDMGTAWVNMYGIALIERVYYINQSDVARSNTVAKTWITPVYGSWSDWSTSYVSPSDTRKVETRKWYSHPLDYNVVYNSNGGVGSMATEKYYYNVAKKLAKNTFIRDGYVFIGWGLNATDTTPTYADEQSVTNIATYSQSSVNLYALWEDIPKITILDIQPEVYNEDGSIRYTNQAVIVTVELEDNVSGLQGFYRVSPSGNTLLTSTFANRNKSKATYTVRYPVMENDNNFLMVKDNYGLTSTVPLVIPNIDVEAPETDEDLVCLESNLYTDYILDLTDDKSGVASIACSFDTLEESGLYCGYSELNGSTSTRASFTKVSDFNISVQYTVKYTIKDKVGNTRTYSCPARRLGIVTATQNQLMDIDYIFSQYKLKYGTTFTSLTVSGFKTFLENDNNAASKVFLKYLEEELAKPQSEVQALKGLFETFGWKD